MTKGAKNEKKKLSLKEFVGDSLDVLPKAPGQCARIQSSLPQHAGDLANGHAHGANGDSYYNGAYGGPGRGALDSGYLRRDDFGYGHAPTHARGGDMYGPYGGPPRHAYGMPSPYDGAPPSQAPPLHGRDMRREYDASGPNYGGPGYPPSRSYDRPSHDPFGPPHGYDDPHGPPPPYGGYGMPQHMFSAPPPPPPPPPPRDPAPPTSVVYDAQRTNGHSLTLSERPSPPAPAPPPMQRNAVSQPTANGNGVHDSAVQSGVQLLRRPAAAEQQSAAREPAVSPRASAPAASPKQNAHHAQPQPASVNGAAAAAAAPLVEPPAAAAPVRNEFAERMAQQALARLAIKSAAPKSGLVEQANGHGEHTTAAAPAPAPPVALPPAPVRSTGGDSPDERPRLKLQPRSVGTDGGAAAAAASAPAEDGGRRKLNLNPRSKPLEGDVANADNGSSAAPAAKVKPNPFGQARAREDVLRERGVEPALVDMDAGYPTGRSGSNPAHHGYGGAPVRGSRAGSVTSGISGDDHGAGDQWTTVGSRGRVVARDEAPGSEFDPFFGHTAGGGGGGSNHGSFARPIPAARAFNDNSNFGNGGGFGSYGRGGGGGYGDGAYGSPRQHGNGWPARNGGGGYDANDDGVVFKRSLPTRNYDPL